MGAQGTATINFGSAPGSTYTTVVVTDALILSTAVAEAWKSGGSTADHNLQEHVLTPIQFTCEINPSGGSFTIHACSEIQISGTFTVNWVWVPVDATIGPMGPTGSKIKWWNSNVTPTTTAVSTSSITVANLPVKPGDPIRILDKAGLYFTNTLPNITANAITGLTGDLLDYRGDMYFKSILVSGVTYRYDIYSDETCLLKIGQTSTFDASATATNVLTITAANNSNLGGTVTATSNTSSRTADVLHRVSFIKKGICVSYVLATGLLTFAGQAVTLTAGNIAAVWLGDRTLVVQYPIRIPSTFASATTSTAFLTKTGFSPNWDLPGATICQVRARNRIADTGGTKVSISPIINGNQLMSDSTFFLSDAATRLETVVQMSTLLLGIAYGDPIELRVVTGSNGDAQDLEGSIVAVID